MWPGVYPMSELAANVKLKIQEALPGALRAMPTCNVQKTRFEATPGAIRMGGRHHPGISTGEAP